MAKYILKKDLPFAKAGAEAKIVSAYSQPDYLYPFYAISIKGDLINEWYRIEIPKERFPDWIEEVKPREFIWVIDFSGNFVRYYPHTYTVEEVRKIQPTSHQVIKVREVLD